VAILQKLLLLGFGNTAAWVTTLAGGQAQLIGTTRDASKAARLKAKGVTPIVLSDSLDDGDELKEAFKDACVLVTFPPDGNSDERFSQLASSADKIIYVSSTHVYGSRTGIIDEATTVDSDLQSAKPRLHAEAVWQKQGAIVLRPPALYGPGYGLHMRLKEGVYKMPEDGANFSSRIHFWDLAQLILSALAKPLERGSTYLVGDLKPTTQKEVVSWLCERMALPMPPPVPLSEVSDRLRVNRQISPRKILADLSLELKFPTYREGFEHCLANEAVVPATK
jgi:hypothetical protein